MVKQITIELETPGDSRTMFRLGIDESLIGDDLTAAQAHVLIGEILERITLPKWSEGATPGAESDPSPPLLSRSALRVFVDTLRGLEDAEADEATDAPV